MTGTIVPHDFMGEGFNLFDSISSGGSLAYRKEFQSKGDEDEHREQLFF